MEEISETQENHFLLISKKEMMKNMEKEAAKQKELLKNGCESVRKSNGIARTLMSRYSENRNSLSQSRNRGRVNSLKLLQLL